jgi:hypothetical protein
VNWELKITSESKAQIGPAGTVQAVKDEETSRYEDLGNHLRDLANQSVHEAPF